MKNLFSSAILMFVALTGFGQASTPSNTLNLPTDFLGWNASSPIDLDVKHEGNHNIIFSTDNAERMRLTNQGQLLINTPTATSLARLEVRGLTVGIRGRANSNSTNNFGGYFTSTGGVDAYGVYGESVVNAAGTNIGVAGEACDGTIANYGVYGEACTSPTATNWAGYFDGKTFCTSGVWDASDANLKTNISSLENATSMLMALEPKSYEFDPSVDALNLPNDTQYGIMAQNLETVIPHAVIDTKTPVRYADDGSVEVESIEFKAVNYGQLIPLLVAGFKEQNTQSQANAQTINELKEKLVELENSLAVVKSEYSEQSVNRLPEAFSNEKVKLLQNSPNPFQNQTNIIYEVKEAGLIRCDIINDNGEVIETLNNNSQDAGEYTLEWNAAGLSAGIYFCVIRHNGEVVIRKMLKH